MFVPVAATRYRPIGTGTAAQSEPPPSTCTGALHPHTAFGRYGVRCRFVRSGWPFLCVTGTGIPGTVTVRPTDRPTGPCAPAPWRRPPKPNLSFRSWPRARRRYSIPEIPRADQPMSATIHLMTTHRQQGRRLHRRQVSPLRSVCIASEFRTRHVTQVPRTWGRQ